MKTGRFLGIPFLALFIGLLGVCPEICMADAEFSDNEAQIVYNKEVAAFRQQTFLSIDLYIKQLEANCEAAIAEEEMRYQSFDEACREAKRFADEKQKEITADIAARYSGSFLVEELETMTRQGITHPQLGNFDVIRRIAPEVQWKNWEQAPAKSLKEILTQTHEEYSRRVFERLEGDKVLEQIEDKIQSEYQMIKVGSRISLRLVGGSPASRNINQMYLTNVLADSIILNNGTRKILRSDISLEDQARIFKDAHDKFIAETVEKETQAFWAKVNKTSEEEMAKDIPGILLQNGYIPDPTKKVNANYYDWAEKIPECWTPMKDYVGFVRNFLISQDVNNEMATTFRQEMQDNGYVEYQDDAQNATCWIHRDMLPFLSFRDEQLQQLNARIEEANDQGGFAVRADDGTLGLISFTDAYLMECSYMKKYMNELGYNSYQDDDSFWLKQVGLSLSMQEKLKRIFKQIIISDDLCFYLDMNIRSILAEMQVSEDTSDIRACYLGATLFKKELAKISSEISEANMVSLHPEIKSLFNALEQRNEKYEQVINTALRSYKNRELNSFKDILNDLTYQNLYQDLSFSREYTIWIRLCVGDFSSGINENNFTEFLK